MQLGAGGWSRSWGVQDVSLSSTGGLIPVPRALARCPTEVVAVCCCSKVRRDSQGWQEAVQCCRGWTLQFLQLNAEHFNLSSAECVHPADGPGPVFDPRLTAGMSPALCSQGMLLSVCSGRGRCSSGCFSCSVPQLRLCSELWAVTWSCVTRIGCSQPATLTDHSQLLV